MDKLHQRDFLEIEEAVKSRLSFLEGLGYSEEEKLSRKEEIDIMLRIINKTRHYRLNPLDSVTTVHGTKFKLGDYFTIPGDVDTKYKIVLFPDEVTVRGEANNPAIGKPWICEVYIESARKVKTEKKKAAKRIKKPKKVKIKEGDYFALVSNNTIYKATEVSKKKVVGINKLKSKNTPKIAKFNPKKTEVVLKTKKDYKKQHKSEKRHGNKKN